MTPPLMAESEEEPESLLMKMKEESEKFQKPLFTPFLRKVEEESKIVGLKLNIQKTQIMASSPITPREIDGETVETVSDFYFWGLQNHCRW